MNMGKGYEDKPMSDIIETLKGVSCATLWGILGDAYTMEHMNPLYGDCKVVGPAATMKYREITADMTPEDVDREIERIGNPIHRLFDAIRPEDIVIGAAMGHERSGVYGDCYATAFKAKGAAAIVTDGSVRDSSGIKELDIPVYTRVPATPLSSRGGGVFPVEEMVTVVCDGVTVRPGDIVVGDGDGVVVVPKERAAKVAWKAEAKERLEALSRRLLMEGKPLRDVYPRLKREYVEEHGLSEVWEIAYSDEG